jgi:hypothetical protein
LTADKKIAAKTEDTKIDPEKQRQKKVAERETGEAPRGNKPESCTPFHQ